MVGGVWIWQRADLLLWNCSEIVVEWSGVAPYRSTDRSRTSCTEWVRYRTRHRCYRCLQVDYNVNLALAQWPPPSSSSSSARNDTWTQWNGAGNNWHMFQAGHFWYANEALKRISPSEFLASRLHIDQSRVEPIESSLNFIFWTSARHWSFFVNVTSWVPHLHNVQPQPSPHPPALPLQVNRLLNLFKFELNSWEGLESIALINANNWVTRLHMSELRTCLSSWVSFGYCCTFSSVRYQLGVRSINIWRVWSFDTHRLLLLHSSSRSSTTDTWCPLRTQESMIIRYWCALAVNDVSLIRSLHGGTGRSVNNLRTGNRGSSQSSLRKVKLV